MNRGNGFSRIFVIVVAAGIALLPARATAGQTYIDTPHLVLDPFIDFNYIPPGQPNADYWWTTLNSSIPLSGRVESRACAGLHPDGSLDLNAKHNCVTHEVQGLNRFIRFTTRPGKPAGSFYFAQLTEIRDANYQTGPQTQRWQPEPGKPVIFVARSRFSPNYKADASGGARGSAGVGLWNMPTTVSDTPPLIVTTNPKSLFFTYTDPDSLNGLWTGYTANVADFEAPPQLSLRFFNIRQYPDGTPVDMTKWITQTIKWSVDSSGVQRAEFYISQEIGWHTKTMQVADVTLPLPLPPLSAVLWVDSAVVDLSSPSLSRSEPPTSRQDHDIDYVLIWQ